MKKAHLVPKCTRDVYVELPVEAEVEEDECGKLIYWFDGCRPAAEAWEEHYSGVLTTVGLARSCGSIFVFVGVDKELDFVLSVLKEHYELKDRGRLGSGRERQERS